MESRDTFSFFKRETSPVTRNTKVSRKYFKHLRAFSKKQKPDKYSGLTDKLNLVIDSKPFHILNVGRCCDRKE